MIGYGFTSNQIHEICIRGIINSFFKRSSFFLLFTYDIIKNYTVQQLKYEHGHQLYNTFITEEKLLDSKNVDDEINIKKYILSANIIKNKNYPFFEKQINEVIEEGKINLENIFFEEFVKFAKSKDFINIVEGNLEGTLTEWFAAINTELGSVYYSQSFKDEVKKVKRFYDDQMFKKEYYIKNYNNKINSTSIHDFYINAGLLTARESYLNMLTQQINALEPEVTK